VGGPSGPAFGGLLREARLAAGLTQAALAVRAGVSVRGLQDLERGLARPQRETRRRLAAALALPAEQRAAFEAAGAPAPRRRTAHAARGARSDPGAAGERPRHNLPLQRTGLVGREAELADVTRRLATARLLTLTGAGGVGKTRLALAAAAAALHGYAGGAWLVALDALADPVLVPQAVAQAVGVREEAHRPLLATLAAALAPRRLLLVLDNCEHLLDACARLTDALLRAGPGVTLLATSREPLGLAGEVVWQVPPLALTDAAPAVPAPPCAAVRLFVERAAAAAAPGFQLTGENAPVLAAICRRLDGLPLAIELAAARVRHLPPAALLARLEAPPGGLPLLTGGTRDAPPRHRTLRATIAWSDGLLPPAAQALFRCLGVFAGGFTLEAAQAVGAATGGLAPAGSDALEGISALVDASLVEQIAAAPAGGEGDTGGARYRLLETIREYALERLQERGELAAARTRHAAYALALAEAAAPELEGPRQLAWLDRLETERDNLRAALRWSQTAGGSAEVGLRLAAALRNFWRFRGRHREGRAWLEAALARPGAEARTAPRAAALGVAGQLARALGDRAAARARLEESAALCRELGDARGLGQALAQLGHLTTPGDATAARALLEEAVALARAAGDRPGLALALRFLGNLEAPRRAAPGGPSPRSPLEESAALCRELGDGWGLGVALTGLAGRALRGGDQRAARAYLEEALAHRRAVDDTLGVALILRDLGALARREGDHRRAVRLCEESRALAQDRGSPELVAAALAELGHIALAVGDAPRAVSLLQESLRLCLDHESLHGLVRTLTGLAAAAAAQGQARRALRLGAAVAAQGKTTGRPLHPAEQAELDGGLARARQALPAAAGAAAWAEGQAMSLAAAAAHALAPEACAGT